jgi:hypothetical protein
MDVTGAEMHSATMFGFAAGLECGFAGRYPTYPGSTDF